MIKIVAVGKCKEKPLIQCIDEYLKRIRPYSKIEVIEVEELMAPQSNSEAQNAEVMKKEGLNLLSRIKDDEYMILLDLHGDSLKSEELAEHLDKVSTYKTSNIAFVIGGSLGLSQEVINRANFRWKLSDLTFPHQLIRLFLVEQIYRSYKILRNEPYHK